MVGVSKTGGGTDLRGSQSWLFERCRKKRLCEPQIKVELSGPAWLLPAARTQPRTRESLLNPETLLAKLLTILFLLQKALRRRRRKRRKRKMR